MSQLHLSLLGEPIVKHGEETLTFSTRKALALLVYLAVEGGMHTRKTLSESLWPELDAEHGRAALRTTLFELRRHLERSHAPDELVHLHVRRDTLEIAQDSPLLLDLRLIEVVSKRAGCEGASEGDGALLAQLEQATSLVRGPFLAGFTLRDSQFFDDWTRQHREYWHLRVQHLFDTLSRLYERAGDMERALDTVSRWLSFDPLHEEGYRRLMRLRFSLGDRAGALRAYNTCREVLAQELELEPEPETVALAKRLRHTAPVRPARTRSLVPPDSSAGQPATSLLDGPYLGRSAEFGALIESYQRVDAGQPQLVLLQGESGMGKTRLATEFLSWAQAQGADVMAGKALQTGRQLPYQPFITVLRHHMEHAPDDLGSPVWLAELAHLLPELRDRSPDLPVPTRDEALGHSRLFEATTRLLQGWAARRPLVLLLDDMQWADTATLDLVLYLAQRLVEQPAPILLLLNLRTGTFSDRQPTWVIALKRTLIPLTTLVLSSFTQEETQRFVQELAWAEQQPEVGNNGLIEGGPARSGSSTFRELLASLARWLYAQTRGQPFYLVETLKGLLEQEIIVPSLQENGAWRLVLRAAQLAQTPTSALIPASVRELLRAQLGQLTPAAWALLVAAAVMGEGLTFERLCQVTQLDEEAGVQALEELLRSGWLCDDKCAEASQAEGSYTFPGEVIREVVYQEAGAPRQRLVQRRVAAAIQEEAEHHQGEEVSPLHPTTIERHAPAETRKWQGKRGVTGAINGGMRGMLPGIATDASGVTWRRANTCLREKTPLEAWERSAATQAALAFSRSPPGSPVRVDYYASRWGTESGGIMRVNRSATRKGGQAQ